MESLALLGFVLSQVGGVVDEQKACAFEVDTVHFCTQDAHR
jgi:hypothetical protein